MVVAVAAVRMMQMPSNQKVDVVAVRNCFMSAIHPVNVTYRMSSAGMRRGARCRVVGSDFQRALVDV
ncbi:MAG TPA: hypothetical protein VGC79_19070, partial [Polyangiaceae bacterium]